MIRLTRSTEGDPTVFVFSPDSPVYNLKNPACGGNVIVPLGTSSGKPVVVALTFCNNSAEDDAIICVVVALSFPPPDQQKQLVVKRHLKCKNGTVVHIVLTPA